MAKSSSTGKKRSKYSSLDRGRKRRKTKGTKTKKLRRHDASESDSYSTDDSRSSASIPVCSEDSYRGRKSRSSIRKDAKRAKRRVRTISSSSEESLRSRNKKGSKRKTDSEVRKKKTLKHKKKKKKSTRDASISSSSSDSSGESEYEGRKGRSRKRKNDLKSLKNDKSRSKKRRFRSRSCSSSCSRDGGGDYLVEEKVTDGNVSKRLKSVITFVKDDMEERERDEIVYEDDGYPSSKSNDSYGSENDGISDYQPPIACEKESLREDLFSIKSTELGEKTHEIAEGSGKVIEDLETILRQKALENLRRFRGGKQINSNDNNNTNKKHESCGAPRSPCLASQNDPKDDCTQEEKTLDQKNECAPVVAKSEMAKSTFDRKISKQRLVTSALKQALSNSMTSTVEEVPKLLKPVKEATAVIGKTESDKQNEACSSASAKDVKSREGEGDVKELERKTMTVMRGGELVEVSYKVYIPKNTPALTRRQLKR